MSRRGSRSTRSDNLVRSDDFTFLLTAGGHNAGIVCGPVHPKRHYRIKTRRLADPHLAPDDWMAAAATARRLLVAGVAAMAGRAFQRQGQAAGDGRAAQGLSRCIDDAPGQYVRQR